MSIPIAVFVSLTLAAPVPSAEPVGEIPSGPAPRLVVLKPNAEGKLTIAVRRREPELRPAANGGNQVLTRSVTVEVPLAELAELKVFAASGRELPVRDALRILSRGGTAVASADGKAVHPGYLQLFRSEVMVLVSPDLINLPRITPSAPTPDAP